MTNLKADAGEDVDELLLPPRLTPDDVWPATGGRTLRLGGDTMGTSWSLAAVVPEDVADSRVQQILMRAFATVITQMSQWEPQSELSRFNKADAGSWQRISPQFKAVLECALQIARESNGAFDPTLGHASEALGFGAAPSPHILPTPDCGSQSWRDIRISENGGRLYQPGGMSLDLSAIAKGFAVDLCISWLRQIGLSHALMEIGGELRAMGVRADGQPWWVDLEQPSESDAPTTRVGLTGWSIATSGNYHRRRSVDGRSWSHSIDPESRQPIKDDVIAATVLHPGCMQADALATVMMILGPEHGITFADRHSLPARIVTKDKVSRSNAWLQWMT